MNVAGALEDVECSAAILRLEPLDRWTLVDARLAHDELARVCVLFLSVRNRALEDIDDERCAALLLELQRRQCFVDPHATDEIRNKANLPRRDAREAMTGVEALLGDWLSSVDVFFDRACHLDSSTPNALGSNILLLVGMTTESRGERKLAELVTNHVFGAEDINEGLAVVDLKRQANELRNDRASAGVCLDGNSSRHRENLLCLAEELLVDEWTFFGGTAHVCGLSSNQSENKLSVARASTTTNDALITRLAVTTGTTALGLSTRGV